MPKQKYFDSNGREVSENDALDRNGAMRDGVVARVHLRDSAGNSRMQFTDGHTDNPLALHRPGFRVPVVNDRRSVRDAYQRYETGMTNAFRVKAGETQCSSCDGSGEDENGETCEACNGTGTIAKGKSAFGSGNEAPDPASDRRTVDQRRAVRDRAYQQYDAELQSAWRNA